MLSIGRSKPNKSNKASTAAGYYFRYYTDKDKEQGVWFGRGAELLGLSGPVLESEFKNLVEGFSKDGKTKLVQNAGAADRQRFWDLVPSPDKSVSVFCLSGPDEAMPEILSCIKSAVHSVLRTVEDELGFSRQGKAGGTVVKAALAFAVYLHLSSRADDPQIHFHCVLPNVGVRPDGSTGAILSKPIFRAKIALGELFQNELARELRSRLGIELEKGPVGYQIKGVPRKLCDVFSKRRKEIEAELLRVGHSDALHARGAAEKTRARKRGTPEKELLVKWRAVAEAHGFTVDHARKILEKGRENLARQAPDVERERGRSPQVSPVAKQETAHGHDAPRSTPKPSLRVYKPVLEREKRVKEFQEKLREIADRIFPERQTSERITKIANGLARRYGIEREIVLASIKQLKLPIHGRLARVEWKKAFRKAPKWSPIAGVRVPRLVLKNQPRRWADIRWEKAIPRIGEASKAIRIQQRKLFPKAPQWSPLSKLSLPAIRVANPRVKMEEKEKALKLQERERSR